MLVNSNAEINKNRCCESDGLTEVELNLISVFRKLSEEHRSDMLRFVCALLAAQ